MRDHESPLNYDGALAIRVAMTRAMRCAQVRQFGTVAPDFEANTLHDRWGYDRAMIQRSGVAGFGTGTGEAMSDYLPGSSELIDAMGRVSAFDQALPAMRRLPERFAAVPNLTRPNASWRGESKSLPATRYTTSRERLQPKRVGGILIAPLELLRDRGNAAELQFRSLMLEALAYSTDSAAFDPSNAGDSSTPRSLTFDAPTVASSGDVADDCAAAIANFGGNLRRAAWFGSPRTLGLIGLRTPNGVGAACGCLGGSLAGLPAYATDATGLVDSDGGALALVDLGACCYLDRGINISVAADVLVEQDSAPQGATDSPTAASATLVSVWQEDSVAMLVSRSIDFKRVTETACVVITGAVYAAP
jgi:hypothetical protein